MTWSQRYQIRSYLRSSLWIVPIIAVVLDHILAVFVHRIDERWKWKALDLGVSGAQATCNSVITLTLSFIVFTFGSLLVAIQVASGQYTPRIIATTLLRNNVIRFAVGLFVFTFLFAIKAMNRIEGSVDQIVVFLTAGLGLSSLVGFLFLIDYAARLLRPVSLVRHVGEAGIEVIRSVYPESLSGMEAPAATSLDPGTPMRTVLHSGTSAIVLAVNTEMLAAEAARCQGVIEFAPQIGDFVGTLEPLFQLYGGARDINDGYLRSTVVFGSERTLEQDPLFAIRILADIAIKALSKAINDPTTAVLAIDQLDRLLRHAGRRNLRSDFLFDPAGELRVIFRTPNWKDFVDLAFTEIRFYGAENIQISRRLRAMIVNLTEVLPEKRQPALQQQLDLLDRVDEKLFVMPEELALARIPDSQGLGGSTHAKAIVAVRA